MVGGGGVRTVDNVAKHGKPAKLKDYNELEDAEKFV